MVSRSNFAFSRSRAEIVLLRASPSARDESRLQFRAGADVEQARCHRLHDCHDRLLGDHFVADVQ